MTFAGRPFRSLRARIAAAAAAAILAAVALLAVVTVLLVNHELRSSLDSALRQRAQEVAELAISTPAVLTDPGALESPVSGRQISVQVLDRRGRIVARSLNLGARVLPEDAVERAARVDGRTGAEDVELDGRPLRLYAAPIADAGGPAAGGAVLVASDTSDIAHTTSQLGGLVAATGAAVALLAALVAAALTRRGLRPLSTLAEAAGEIEATADPTRRLPEATLDEIGRLTGVLNRMLASLEEARASERRLLADASHELRTPVTALLGNVEYAVRHGADEEVLADLRHDARRLARLVDSLLALERAGEGTPQLVPLRLDELVRVAVDERDPGRVHIGTMDRATVAGDADALRRAVGNLIENGLVHGPARGHVTVSLDVADHRALLNVTDQGSGPDPELHGQLFERFWRGAGASDRPGSGLGLSIVAAIAAHHHGRVLVNGSTFTLDLPVVRAAGGRQEPGSR
ncbi:MAG TPA: HAMP domain-containing sensor histidine kinase [Solirubrobacteraceae bacterium]|nr:HAMP domain-containing sensor histidine kinase [Solirubrobacteraceae bacterium]